VPTLLIGCNPDQVEALNAELPARSVTLLEEPDIIRKKRLECLAQRLECLAEVVPCRYHEANDFLRVGVDAHTCKRFEAVVPGREYAVPAAAALAHRLGLPGASEPAAATLRNKLRLRAVTSRAGIRNPEWREVRTVEDVRSFAAGGPVVIKPANRQASLGVQVVDDDEHLDAAWLEMLAASEEQHVPDRALSACYLAERRLVGQEYSVEAIVRDGRILFDNVTEKTVLPGPHPVEVGHVVPAAVDAATAARFSDAMRALVAATGFAAGVLHAEWFLTGGEPVLVECAGRLPGDRIPDLIQLARGVRMYRAVVDVLSNRAVDQARPAREAAAVRFLVAAPGRVRAVRGVEDARRLAGVRQVRVGVATGDRVPPIRSSWDRCGWVMVTAPGAERAKALAERAAGMIEIATTGG
jgi:biotin carboxylase